MLSGRAEEKSVQLSVELPEPLSVTADSTRLRQVLINLVGNAVKFTPEGGKIVLGAHAQPGPMKDREIWISVADTGIGIQQADYARIFQEFEQIDSSLTRSEEGSGLGLALSKHLVELHKGRIWFESKYGQGTTFWVALPADS